MALLMFAITLFVSAFLLFMVQPMVGKMILPKLGGTPQVWNTCCMFFQCALLAGYGYTHSVSSKLKTRTQLVFHGLILLVPLALLIGLGPFNIDWGWEYVKPTPGANPIGPTLLILAIVVAVPFIVVATSAPLLQRWFAETGHPASKDPYFLYGASNLGSMLALLSYPVLIEPLLAIQDQALTWAIGYGVLALLIGFCAFLVLKAPPSVQLAGAGAEVEPPPAMIPEAAQPASTEIKTGPAPSASRSTGIRKGSKQRGRHPGRSVAKTAAALAPAVAAPRPFEMSAWKRLRWVMLAAVPCSMMLGVTTYISTDISAIPLFWVIPLALYLLSFILVFLKWPVAWATPESPTIPKPLQLISLALFVINVLGFLILNVLTNTASEIIVGLVALTILILFALVLLGPILFPGYHWRGVPHIAMVVLQPFALLPLALVVLHAIPVSPIYRSTFICMMGFFLTAMVCHGELARDRPPTRYLTEFFLWMSVGGALGGIFNAILAPLLFVSAMEFQLALVAVGLLRPLWPGEPWSYNMFKSLMPPETIESLDRSGDDLVRRLKGIPPESDAAKPLAPVAERGFLFNGVMDLVLPALVFVVAYVLIFQSEGVTGWYQGIYKFFLNVGFANAAAQGLTFAVAPGLVYGIPLICCLLFFGRPVRFGLTLAAVLLAHGLHDSAGQQKVFYAKNKQGDYILNERGDKIEVGYRKVIRADRSYFGILKVQEESDETREGPVTQRSLMHGTTHHGLNYQEPKKLRRLATTYYHRYGPVGVVMERLNWFPYNVDAGDKVIKDAQLEIQKTKGDEKLSEESEKKLPGKVNDLWAANDRLPAGERWAKVLAGLTPQERIAVLKKRHPYEADARLPVSVIGLGATNLAGLGIPLAGLSGPQIVAMESEPPYACVGLGTGTMASYTRPFQHMTFYEIDDKIRRFSKPDDGSEPFYTYVHDADKRGGNVEVIMGDARLSLYDEDPNLTTMPAKREKYYRVIELDAFSSDAIPVHLITKEAIKMYFDKLTEDGVLMVHTSNRHVNLVLPVTKVASELGLKYRVGKDGFDRRSDAGDENNRGRFGSEYVMIARDEKYLPRSTPDTDPQWDALRKEGRMYDLIWYTPAPPQSRTWTDDYSGMVGVLRWGLPFLSVEGARMVPDNPPRGGLPEEAADDGKKKN